MAQSRSSHTYWYPAKTVEQESLLPGGPTIKKDVPVGDGHILYSGRLLCRETMEALKNRAKADKEVKSTTPLKNVPVCADCSDRYKTASGSPWERWVSPPELKKQPINQPIREDLFESRKA